MSPQEKAHPSEPRIKAIESDIMASNVEDAPGHIAFVLCEIARQLARIAASLERSEDLERGKASGI